jgi:glycosyltransferase involved in cell wall biosynthesis
VSLNSKPLTLSIVIPVYNEEHYLRRCLDAIAVQTEKPDEVVVVDNNSTDSTVEIAREYDFVKLITEPKQSVLYARTTGFDAATSDVIGRIDADTVLDTNWCKRVRQVFLADKHVAAATGPVYWYDMPLKEKNYVAEHVFKSMLYKYDKEFPFLFGANMAIRNKDWQSIRSKLCDKKDMHEDMDLAIHLYQEHYHIVYDSKMRAGASSRRMDSGPEAFYQYSIMMNNAFASHNINPTGAKVAVAAYSLGYFLLYPLRRSYDPVTGKRSLKQFVRGNKPRKNPME